MPPASDSPSEPAHASHGPANRHSPWMLRTAVLIVAVQIAGLVVLAFGSVPEILAADGPEQVTVVTLAVVLIGLGALFGAAARALWRGQRWGRGPVLTWQLLLVAVGVSGLGGTPWWANALLVVSAVAVLAGVLHPRARAFTTGSGRPEAMH